MPKYNFHTKRSKESISVTHASSSEEAVSTFAKIKNLGVNAFLDLYEVSKIRD